MVITHEMELLALMGRYVELIDSEGTVAIRGLLVRLFDAGRVAWRVSEAGNHSRTWQFVRAIHFELGDVADIAGTVIELRGGAR